MNSNVLLLAPSRGLGGGIERYVSTIEAAFHTTEVSYRRVDLRNTDQPLGARTKFGFVRTVRRLVRASEGPIQLVLAHGNLLPVVYAVARSQSFSGATVILHGREAWSPFGRNCRWAMRRPDVRVVAASGFTAGALSSICQANVLHPGVSADWYRMLMDAGRQASAGGNAFNLVTAFRLGDWREKGLPTILRAVQLLHDERIQLTICGTGQVSAELREEVAAYPWCTIAPNLTDRELAQCLAAADLFVLATRTRHGARACGEGFGLALLEAQLAGTPVIAPAYSGSSDAFQHGLTGLSPIDETPRALSAVINTMLYDTQRRIQMAQTAATWSRANFEPINYARHMVRMLLGDGRAVEARHGS